MHAHNADASLHTAAAAAATTALDASLSEGCMCSFRAPVCVPTMQMPACRHPNNSDSIRRLSLAAVLSLLRSAITSGCRVLGQCCCCNINAFALLMVLPIAADSAVIMI
jgi:hypothetical protein